MFSHQFCTVLHPPHKLTCFRNAKWLERWITDVETLVCDEFESYPASDNASDNEETVVSSAEQGEKPSNIFDQLDVLAPPKLSDLWSKLDHYLTADIEHVTDTLVWWYKRCSAYPRLSRMALDYLSIPGMSTSPVVIYLTD